VLVRMGSEDARMARARGMYVGGHAACGMWHGSVGITYVPYTYSVPQEASSSGQQSSKQEDGGGGGGGGGGVALGWTGPGRVGLGWVGWC
jgi:hypothetical protein